MNNGYNGIWVFAEQREGRLHDVSFELLGKARDLADPAGLEVTAILLGHGMAPSARRLFEYGADSVLAADDLRLAEYRLIPYTRVIEAMIRKFDPEILLMGATAMGVELAPRVAARIGTGLSAHCIDLKMNEQGKLLQVVPGWGGGLLATITCPEHRPQMATVMPGAMKALSRADGEGAIREFAVDLPESGLGPEVVEIIAEKGEELPLEKAEVIVAGGWGVGSAENWKLIEGLAEALGGAVGATRPPVDEGWAKEGQMIGQSGKTVRPSLYIGVGISGVMHHLVGMDQSKTVISINTDPKAEIFQASDVVVVADFRKILPRLIDEIKARVEK
jgi:electron transfer flavoprotein alpha subunit